MLISTKGRYALRVMADLAEHPAEGDIPLKEIAQRREISEKYLEAIIKTLVKARMLTGVRGREGGYKLTRGPEQYTGGEILRLTEETLAPVTCLEETADVCPRALSCRALPIWKGLNRVINEYLDPITMAGLMRSCDAGKYNRNHQDFPFPPLFSHLMRLDHQERWAVSQRPSGS